jgi:hypothetical protein
MSDTDPNTGHLQQSLQRLHTELAQTPQVNEGARQLLRDVLGDIERLLRRPESSVAAQSGPSQSKLEALAVDFEAEHPALAASVRQFVDLLGRAGL